MRIAIAKPPRAGRRSGNQQTADRWAAHLRRLGHRVSVSEGWSGTPDDLLIALHARKSHAAIARFPGPVVVVLTGTDLYPDLRGDAAAQASLEVATRLVVLQPEGLRELTDAQRAKAVSIFQSSNTLLRSRPPARPFRIAVVGHLRAEKDPFRAAEALRCLADRDDLEVIQIGEALSAEMGREARARMKQDPRYHWLGSLTHRETLGWIARIHLLVVSSVLEGGANVICEAARIGTPVLASKVAGNVGMLGRGYPGYFPLFDERALARLFAKAADDLGFRQRLESALALRRPSFSPAVEREGLRRLIRTVRPCVTGTAGTAAGPSSAPRPAPRG